MESELKNEPPNAEEAGGTGVTCMIRTAEKYAGEYDYINDNGVFIFRLVMNLQPEYKRGFPTRAISGMSGFIFLRASPVPDNPHRKYQR